MERVAPRPRVSRRIPAPFVALIAANLLKVLGFSAAVNAAGNLLFMSCAIVTLTGAFLAWRRGSSAAGWFLVAWSLLESFTIVAAFRLLLAPGAAWEDAVRAHGEAFSGVNPANTTYFVAGFIPDVLVEFELDALISSADDR